MRYTRKVAALAVAMVGVLGLSACGGDSGGGGASGDGGPVELRFSWWGSDARHKMTQQLIDAFQAEFPNIKIKGEYTGWGDYFDKLATSTAGGDMPDIVQQETRYVREYGDRKALLDLNEQSSVIKTDKLDEAVLGGGKVDGKTYAVPTGVNVYSVVADTTIYEQLGVELPDDKSWTWDEFVAKTAEVTSKGNGVFGMQNIGFNEVGLEIMARQRGEAMFKEDGTIGVSDKTLEDWFALILKMRDAKSEPPASVSIEVQNAGIDQSLLSTNRGAGGVFWTNELNTLTNSSKHELKLLRWPGESPKAGMYLKPAMFLSVSARTDHPAEAATFVNWMVNSPKAAEIQLSDRGLPINTELREAVTPKLKAADQAAAAFIKEITPDLEDSPILPPPGAGEVQKVFQQLNEQVLFDRISPAEAAKQFRSQAEAALK